LTLGIPRMARVSWSPEREALCPGGWVVELGNMSLARVSLAIRIKRRNTGNRSRVGPGLFSWAAAGPVGGAPVL
jgi:hypothetical protein